MSGFWLVSYIVLWVLFIGQTLLVIGVLQQLGVLQRTLGSWSPGAVISQGDAESRFRRFPPRRTMDQVLAQNCPRLLPKPPTTTACKRWRRRTASRAACRNARCLFETAV